MCYLQLSQICRRRSSICRALAYFGRVPNPLNSYEDFLRFRHADLDGAPRTELCRELAALRQVVALQRMSEPWLGERIEKLELALRHGA